MYEYVSYFRFLIDVPLTNLFIVTLVGVHEQICLQE